MEILSIENLIDDKKCYETIRDLRWGEEGVTCPHCNSAEIIKRGKDDQNKHNQRYECNSCSKRFDDTTGTIFSGRHQSLKIWILFSEVLTKYWICTTIKSKIIKTFLGQNDKS